MEAQKSEGRGNVETVEKWTAKVPTNNLQC